MSNEIQKTTEKSDVVAATPEFKGYTLEELKYQRALLALQKEFAKSKVIHNLSKVQNHKFLGNSNTKTYGLGKFGGIASKILSGLSYVDYAMLGMSLFTSGRKVYSFFRRKK